MLYNQVLAFTKGLVCAWSMLSVDQVFCESNDYFSYRNCPKHFVHQSFWQNCICKKCRPRSDCSWRSMVCHPTKYFKKQLRKKQNLGRNGIEWSVQNFRTFNPYPAVHDNHYFCKQCRFRSGGVWRSKLIRIYIVCNSVCEFERKIIWCNLIGW